ncbi:MAG: cadmium-translocating P-type ATPase [Lysobacteraceae bacterium]|nr:MAG: cadmium-translocating P-type ATPase [Xanthomonadaceae bacterium]
MNTVAAVVGDAAATTTACFHCGDPLPATPATLIVDGTTRDFCCTGCAAAAQWIRDAHLDDYYRLRERPGRRIDADDAALLHWDREDVLAGHARDVDGGRELVVVADGMHCAACAWLIDRALSREDGVLAVSANAVTGRVRIAWDPRRTPLSQPLRRLQALGYRPYLAAGEAREAARQSERNRWLLRIGIAGLGAMQAMMFAEALYLDTANEMSLPMRDFMRWITFLVSTPVVFYAGWPFLSGAVRELRERAPGMDTLVASSTLLAYVASVVETVRGGPDVWYDAAVMFVFLLLAARMLERRVRDNAGAQVDALARARPALALRETVDGGTETVPLAQLATGEIVRIPAGEAAPADGVLLDDDARFGEALLTGESHPIHKQAGDTVYAGSLCDGRTARIRVEKTGGDTRLAQFAALVEAAQAQRPPAARQADRIARVFVTAQLIGAVVLYLGWRAYAPERAFEVALAWMVISCPCALSMAIPAALAAASSALAKLGVLPVRAGALDRLATIDTLVFDKTGTLSDGEPVLDSTTTFDGMARDQALRIAAALERDSTHPLAKAFAGIADAPRASAATVHAGAGIEGIVDGRRWRLGHAAFACDGDDDGALWLGDGARAWARFNVHERPRDDARAALSALHAQGLDVRLLSGDGQVAVRRFAAALGIGNASARQTPEQKLAAVRHLQATGHAVAMVGDGINDAPVLAGADVSFAIGDGAALAARSADLVLASPALLRIPQAIALARRTRTVIRQNLAWALGYNLLALPLAALGLVTPWMAALGMALSSLTVTLNALRLARAPRMERAP